MVPIWTLKSDAGFKALSRQIRSQAAVSKILYPKGLRSVHGPFEHI